MIFHTRLLFWFPDAHMCPGSVQSVQPRHFPASISGVIIALSECPLLLTFQSSLTSIISDLVRQGVLYSMQLFEHPGNFVFSSVQWDGPWVYLMELLWRLNELIHARCLERDQAQSEYHVGTGCHFFFNSLPAAYMDSMEHNRANPLLPFTMVIYGTGRGQGSYFRTWGRGSKIFII